MARQMRPKFSVKVSPLRRRSVRNPPRNSSLFFSHLALVRSFMKGTMIHYTTDHDLTDFDGLPIRNPFFFLNYLVRPTYLSLPLILTLFRPFDKRVTDRSPP